MGITNTIGDFIRSCFSGAVNKTGKVFMALLADPGTEKGTLEKLFSDIETERLQWNKSSLYEQTGTQLALSMNAFSVLNKEYGETEDMFRNRNRVIFDRGANISTWGTGYDVLQTMKKLLNTEEVYLVNNCSAFTESHLKNGDFRSIDEWILDGGSYDESEKFMGAISMSLPVNTTCSQSARLEPGTYFLHFFITGTVSVQIKNSSNQKWNPAIQEWTTDDIYIPFIAEGWGSRNMFFFLKDSSDDVTVIFRGEDGVSHVDYVRLIRKDAASTFTVVCIYNTNTDSVGYLAPGKDDPDDHIDYDKAAYYSQSYVQGGTAKSNVRMYDEVLDNISAAGVNAVLEILNRD